MLEHTACAAVLKRKVARFLVRRWALRPERREAAPWGGATTGDGKTPWNVRPAGFPDSGVHRVEERWKWGQVFCCRTRYARGWGFHLQAREKNIYCIEQKASARFLLDSQKLRRIRLTTMWSLSCRWCVLPLDVFQHFSHRDCRTVLRPPPTPRSAAPNHPLLRYLGPEPHG